MRGQPLGGNLLQRRGCVKGRGYVEGRGRIKRRSTLRACSAKTLPFHILLALCRAAIHLFRTC